MPDTVQPNRRSVEVLRIAAGVVVALMFLVAGGQKIVHPDAGVTMLARYASSPRVIGALGCAEIAMGLGLISFRFPRSAAALAVTALLGFSVLIGLELRRTQPLPCGCLPLVPGATDPHRVRRGLWVGLGRNGFLIVLSLGSAALSAPRRAESELIEI